MNVGKVIDLEKFKDRLVSLCDLRRLSLKTIGEAVNDSIIDGAQTMRWISVKDELPPKHTWSLISNDAGIHIAFIDSEGKWVNEYGTVDADYWMTLPEKPKNRP